MVHIVAVKRRSGKVEVYDKKGYERAKRIQRQSRPPRRRKKSSSNSGYQVREYQVKDQTGKVHTLVEITDSSGKTKTFNKSSVSTSNYLRRIGSSRQEMEAQLEAQRQAEQVQQDVEGQMVKVVQESPETPMVPQNQYQVSYNQMTPNQQAYQYSERTGEGTKFQYKGQTLEEYKGVILGPALQQVKDRLNQEAFNQYIENARRLAGSDRVAYVDWTGTGLTYTVYKKSDVPKATTVTQSPTIAAPSVTGGTSPGAPSVVKTPPANEPPSVVRRLTEGVLGQVETGQTRLPFTRVRTQGESTIYYNEGELLKGEAKRAFERNVGQRLPEGSVYIQKVRNVGGQRETYYRVNPSKQGGVSPMYEKGEVLYGKKLEMFEKQFGVDIKEPEIQITEVKMDNGQIKVNYKPYNSLLAEAEKRLETDPIYRAIPDVPGSGILKGAIVNVEYGGKLLFKENVQTEAGRYRYEHTPLSERLFEGGLQLSAAATKSLATGAAIGYTAGIAYQAGTGAALLKSGSEVGALHLTAAKNAALHLGKTTGIITGMDIGANIIQGKSVTASIKEAVKPENLMRNYAIASGVTLTSPKIFGATAKMGKSFVLSQTAAGATSGATAGVVWSSVKSKPANLKTELPSAALIGGVIGGVSAGSNAMLERAGIKPVISRMNVRVKKPGSNIMYDKTTGFKIGVEQVDWSSGKTQFKGIAIDKGGVYIGKGETITKVKLPKAIASRLPSSKFPESYIVQPTGITEMKLYTGKGYQEAMKGYFKMYGTGFTSSPNMKGISYDIGQMNGITNKNKLLTDVYKSGGAIVGSNVERNIGNLKVNNPRFKYPTSDVDIYFTSPEDYSRFVSKGYQLSGGAIKSPTRVEDLFGYKYVGTGAGVKLDVSVVYDTPALSKPPTPLGSWSATNTYSVYSQKKNMFSSGYKLRTFSIQQQLTSKVSAVGSQGSSLVSIEGKPKYVVDVLAFGGKVSGVKGKMSLGRFRSNNVLNVFKSSLPVSKTSSMPPSISYEGSMSAGKKLNVFEISASPSAAYPLRGTGWTNPQKSASAVKNMVVTVSPVVKSSSPSMRVPRGMMMAIGSSPLSSSYSRVSVPSSFGYSRSSRSVSSSLWSPASTSVSSKERSIVSRSLSSSYESSSWSSYSSGSSGSSSSVSSSYSSWSGSSPSSSSSSSSSVYSSSYYSSSSNFIFNNEIPPEYTRILIPPYVPPDNRKGKGRGINIMGLAFEKMPSISWTTFNSEFEVKSGFKGTSFDPRKNIAGVLSKELTYAGKNKLNKKVVKGLAMLKPLATVEKAKLTKKEKTVRSLFGWSDVEPKRKPSKKVYGWNWSNSKKPKRSKSLWEKIF